MNGENGSDTQSLGLNNRQMAALSSLLVDRKQLARRLGETFSGDRKVYEEAGYPKSISVKQFYQRYRRQPAARRVIDMPVNTTWKNAPEVSEAEKPDGTEFTAAWEKLADRLGVWREFSTLDRHSRLGEYAVMLIGVSDTPSEALELPLQRLRDSDDVLHLDVYPQFHAEILTYVDDHRDPRNRMPETYLVTLQGGRDTERTVKAKVHHSRLIHAVEDPFSDRIHGLPALEPIWNALLDLEKINAGTGEGYWQQVVRPLLGNVDVNAQLSAEDKKELGEGLEELAHKLRRQFIGKGIDLSWMDGNPADPTGAAKNARLEIAVGSGLPMRKLFGSETGERSSEQDDDSYNGFVAQRQIQHAEPAILRAFIDRLVDAGALPPHGHKGYDVAWPELKEASEEERANANLARAQTAKELTAMGGEPLELGTIDEHGDFWLTETTPDTRHAPPPPEPEGAE